ncbi:MAG: diguanylate cyclase [Sulfurospirillaceae bacterium]|nr:diguanylate cyclase [Sulfurospirillaceae bacterium]
MLIEEFIEKSRNMYIYHVFFDEKKLNIFDKIALKHKNFYSKNIYEIGENDYWDFLFVEADDASKEKLKTILGLFQKHKPLCSYIFAENTDNIFLLKFALHFGISDVLPINKKEHLLATLFPKNANKIDEKLPKEVSVQEIKDGKFPILDTFDFIEILKDKLAQDVFGSQKLSLITIDIENFEKLNKAYGPEKIYDWLKNFTKRLETFKNSTNFFTRWNSKLFVFLCEDIEFEEIKEQTQYIHQELIESDINGLIAPVITSYSILLDGQDLNTTIQIIEKIDAKRIDGNNFKKNHFFAISYLDNITDENEKILHLLKNSFSNKSPIKLLNIYKGLCINTNSEVLKITNNGCVVKCETLQGYSMQIEGETVLQTLNYKKDIKATVVHVDIKKSLAILSNLKFLSTSANNRQHTRVQTNIRTPILIKHQRTSLQGEIIDISINSIAIKLSFFPKEHLLGSLVKLYFSLPDDSIEEGVATMEIDVIITHVLNFNEGAKVVTMLQKLEKPYDEYLLRYMYSRQKELILEVKKATKIL